MRMDFHCPGHDGLPPGIDNVCRFSDLVVLYNLSVFYCNIGLIAFDTLDRVKNMAVPYDIFGHIMPSLSVFSHGRGPL